jgi:hypothetical protein
MANPHPQNHWSDYLVFVDESGDHELDHPDPAYPLFVLVFCVVRKSDYARVVAPTITEFKCAHFGHDQVILHERDIRKDLGDFASLRDSETKARFLQELTSLVDAMPIAMIASVIRKDRLVAEYEDPANPYQVALGFGLERVHQGLQRQAASGTTTVIIERRGRREDEELEAEFRRICRGANHDNAVLKLRPRFVSKAANVPGLQIADLCARPIGRHVLDPTQTNRAFEVIERKLARGAQGRVEGWGLKIFP